MHVPTHTDGELWGWISDGVRGTQMPAYRSALTDEERWHLVNFLRYSFGAQARASGR